MYTALKVSKLMLLVVSLLFVRNISSGQSSIIKGTLVDAEDNSPLTGATVRLVDLKDSTQWKGAITDINGAFEFKALRNIFLLKASFIGYSSISKSLAIDKDTVDLGKIKMSEATTLLKGVVVEGRRQPVEILGDSLQYNADAFKTNPDANVEDLVTKMPGVTSVDGVLKVNGETIQQILVDGKPFFGQDPNLALKNLPAQVVDKIQVFDRQSEQSQFTGFDDGETLKTINIVTRPGMNNGQFGRIYAGYGLDDKYALGGNFNSFKGDRRISIVGLSNNVNQQNFSTEDLIGAVAGRGGRRGRPGPGGSNADNFIVGGQSGISKTNSIGLNFSDSWGSKIKLNGSYFFNNALNNNNAVSNRTFITSIDSALIYNESSIVTSENYNHRFNLRVEYSVDSSNSFIITPNLSWQKNNSQSYEEGITMSGNEMESHIQTASPAYNLAYNFSNNILYRHRFKKKGRTLSLNLRTDMKNKDRETNLNSLNQFADKSDSTINQESDQLTNEYGIYSRATFTEPIGQNTQLQINYAPLYKQGESKKETRNFNSGEQEYLFLDSALSNTSGNTYIAHKSGIGLNYRKMSFRFSAGVDYQYSILRNDQSFPSSFQLKKYFQNILPHVNLNYRFSRDKNLGIRYRTSTKDPSVSDLQSVVDNSNPLFLSTGNPDLKQQYAHNISFRYNHTNVTKASSIFLLFNTDFTRNYIANTTIIPTADSTVINGVVLNRGTQLSLPVNLDGYFASRAFFTYAFPVTTIKSNLNLNTEFAYNRSPTLISEQKNLSNSYNVNQGLAIASNISENVDFSISYTAGYSTVKNSIQKASDYSYFNQNTSVKFNWIFLNGFVFNTNLQHVLYSGLSEDLNQNFTLWNASFGYKFFEDRSLELKVSVYDILNQNNSVSRTVTETYIEDRETTSLRRYFLLTLSYNIRKFS